MRLDITAKNVGVIATQNFAFLTIEDENGSRLEVTLTSAMLDYLEQQIAQERRIAQTIKVMSEL